jgi:hypothetical protein
VVDPEECSVLKSELFVLICHVVHACGVHYARGLDYVRRGLAAVYPNPKTDGNNLSVISLFPRPVSIILREGKTIADKKRQI